MKRQRGFSLVAALFLIVVLAMLGAFAVRIGAGQQQTVNLALLSSRALSAAKAGTEWGGYRAMRNSACTTSNLTLSEGALTGFRVRVQCRGRTHSEQGLSIRVYDITATARFGTYGQPDFVSRVMRASFSCEATQCAS